MTPSQEKLKPNKPYASLPFYAKIYRDIKGSPILYLMLLPVLAYYILFRYKPMYGLIISFTDYYPGAEMLDMSSWVGLENFKDFFTSIDFFRVIRNTLTISISTIVFGFPAPILFALMLNELKSQRFSKMIQTISYLPHFISLIVICGLIRTFVGSSGFITQLLASIGLAEAGVSLLGKGANFLPIYVVSDIWQTVGYGSIIYLAAITGVSQELYEAATVDGAGRWKQVLNVTIPCILPTIITMLLLRMGNVMTVGYEKIMLLYAPQIYENSDVISTYVYRSALQQGRFSYSTAVGLFNSLINFSVLILCNYMSKKFNETSLW